MDAIAQLNDRLDSLERSNRRYRRALFGLVVGLAVAIPFIPSESHAEPPPPPPKDAKFATIQAERVALMKDGKVKMLLNARGEKTTISMHGPKGNPRMTLSLSKTGDPMVALNGGDKKPRATLTQSPARGGHLLLWGPGGKLKKKLP